MSLPTKAKCEEIVIERYLKGDIGNEFKDALLWGINERRDNERYLEVMFGVLKDDSKKEALKILETMVKVISKQRVAGVGEEFINKLVKELEYEPSE
jgi:hypothetical protein